MAQRRNRRRGRSNELSLVPVALFIVWARMRHYLHLPWIAVWIVVILAIFTVGLTMVSRNKRRFKKATINDIDRMSGIDFEQALLYYFTKSGWRLKDTKTSGDFGADLIGTDPSGQRCVIQSKRWKSKVGVDAVNQVIAAREYYKATRALVVTNNWLTKNARELAKHTNVETWERNQLQRLIQTVQPKS